MAIRAQTAFVDTLRRRTEQASATPAFLNYLRVRDAVCAMMDEWSEIEPAGRASDYWTEEIEGFLYLFDASPLMIEKLREQSYHISGLKPYEYRAHHNHLVSSFTRKLASLRAVDQSSLFVPEARELGGFGFDIGPGLVNIDTLKFYEVLIGLDKCGVLRDFRAPDRHHTVVEIGGGWGGFAYQLKTLFPSTTYVCVDLPPTLLFSGVYLTTLFPAARALFFGDTQFEEELKNIDKYDFVFLPHHFFSRFEAAIDLAINMVSFQEMTSEQVEFYARRLKELGVRSVYSLNRDRSKHNDQLHSVSGILKKYYRMNPVRVLDIQYNQLGPIPTELKPPGAFDYRHYLATTDDMMAHEASNAN